MGVRNGYDPHHIRMSDVRNIIGKNGQINSAIIFAQTECGGIC